MAKSSEPEESLPIELPPARLMEIRRRSSVPREKIIFGRDIKGHVKLDIRLQEIGLPAGGATSLRRPTIRRKRSLVLRGSASAMSGP
jgi:hypothetical protein